MPTHFSAAAIRFLKGLKKHNDRAWFADRKAVYEAEVQLPWLAFIDAVNEGLEPFAPDYVKPARKAAMRIYRDIRFSKDKRPYKHHVGAWWSPAGFTKTTGAGFYAQVSGDDILLAAGVFMPSPEQTLAIRRYLQEHHAAYRALLDARPFRRLLPDFDGNPLTRMPKGFLPDDPAAELLLCRQWGVSVRLPVEQAQSPTLVKDVTRVFRAATPWVEFLNVPLLRATPRKSLF